MCVPALTTQIEEHAERAREKWILLFSEFIWVPNNNGVGDIWMISAPNSVLKKEETTFYRKLRLLGFFTCQKHGHSCAAHITSLPTCKRMLQSGSQYGISWLIPGRTKTAKRGLRPKRQQFEPHKPTAQKTSHSPKKGNKLRHQNINFYSSNCARIDFVQEEAVWRVGDSVYMP